MGIKTVEQLKKDEKAQTILNKRQKIGLKYFEEFNMRIPREKVTRISEYFKQIVFRIAKSSQYHLM
jgi:hypothetical protein